MRSLLKKRECVMFMMLIGISLCITIITPTFITPSNLLSIVMNNVILAIMAMGMTLVIVTCFSSWYRLWNFIRPVKWNIDRWR